MENEGSFLCKQYFVTGAYPDLDKFIPNTRNLFL
jgi:hypothetical protein